MIDDIDEFSADVLTTKLASAAESPQPPLIRWFSSSNLISSRHQNHQDNYVKFVAQSNLFETALGWDLACVDPGGTLPAGIGEIVAYSTEMT
jgi:hypothetical protein